MALWQAPGRGITKKKVFPALCESTVEEDKTVANAHRETPGDR